MNAFTAVFLITGLITASILAWNLIEAIVFRMTQTLDYNGRVGACFAVAALAVAGAVKVIFPEAEIGWASWESVTLAYCVCSAALVSFFVVMGVLGMAWESLVAAIRGEA